MRYALPGSDFRKLTVTPEDARYVRYTERRICIKDEGYLSQILSGHSSAFGL